MSITKAFPLRSHLTSFFLGISILTAILFGELLIRHFEYGIEDSVKMRVLLEWRAYSLAHKSDPQLPLPQSYVVSFYYDELPTINIEGVNILEHLILKNDEFIVVYVDETITDNIDQEMTLGIYKFRRHDQRVVYGIAKYDHQLISDTTDIWFDNRFDSILYIATWYICIILLALWYYSFRIGKRTEQLVMWSERVSSDLTSNPIPNFKFDEYNRVALYLEKALRKNARLVEREKNFLSHTSHELRTPVAIIRANMEILDRIPLPESSKGSIERIDRASKNMQQIIETMLWLVRKTDTSPAEKKISIPLMLDHLTEELSYLVNKEDVVIRTDYAHAPSLVLPETPFQIVVANLVRNAFQYTHFGQIKIHFENNCIIIENFNTQDIGEQFKDGFGLGQDLTKKICCKLGWRLDTKDLGNGFIARLYLPIKND
ncbi:HAMP domain-containing histidine kinase [Vibrio tubiashii]|uniref:sensor histidine kinase n=2 Tax=Vibrio tubiashii TaxID=29498 RepID=UPI001EFCA780|nr:HAMP domain-containing sensor histidine kinase [Vibrio tubiashii]MCG9582437.1 HAMP domain-containing histidine kinase [Vibrio tubiashii]MCG9616028.1 HAMP domain-containing histidine kinase [Vibrio tubiashii]